MSTEDLLELIREYPLPEGWYAHVPGLQEPANYGTKFETGIYEEQVKSGYWLPLHPFALHFFEHYHMAPGQLVPNGWRKLIGLIYLMYASGSMMLSRFEMARQVAAKKAQQKRDAIRAAEEATRPAEELSKRKADYLAQIKTLEKRLEWAKRRTTEEAKKAKEMFAKHFPDIPLGDFVMPAVASPEIAMPLEAGDAAASHPPEEGPSGDAPEP
ncbi:hypothetical protein RJ639_028774 [Escallonia herrerae]|uniref:Transposase (putative) gypsy type domain-containing protein n=1 Tax=Escallonia herrerae TaxID=1293975 RepID=A0AA88X8K6_9ASTE|nr:hypothetical protein RJ639_028774 [Escallonia herrerae]